MPGPSRSPALPGTPAPRHSARRRALATLAALATLGAGLPVRGVDSGSPDQQVEMIVFDLGPAGEGEPLLTIRADGVARAGARLAPGDAPIAMPADRVAALLDFIVDEQHFFDLEVDAIEAEVQAARAARGGLPLFADGPLAVVRVRLGERSHEIRYYAVSATVAAFPQAVSLQRLAAVVDRLRHEAAWVAAGGESGVQAALALANARLARERPRHEPLIAADLEAAFTDATGTRVVQFLRGSPDARAPLNVVVRYPPRRAPPEVTLAGG